MIESEKRMWKEEIQQVVAELSPIGDALHEDLRIRSEERATNGIILYILYGSFFVSTLAAYSSWFFGLLTAWDAIKMSVFFDLLLTVMKKFEIKRIVRGIRHAIKGD